MSRAQTRSVDIPGPAGGLEAVVESPDAAHADAVAVVCHPHPVYHGTMNNKVVHTVARAVNLLNRPAVRFNFRGVGKSQGEYANGQGETEDALAVIGWARESWPAAELWLAGFSFGAFVALRAAAEAAPACLVTIAPPIQRFAVTEQRQPNCPWLIVQGDRDELVDGREVADWASRLRQQARFELMPDTDHFFHGRLTQLRELIQGFLTSHAPACEDP